MKKIIIVLLPFFLSISAVQPVKQPQNPAPAPFPKQEVLKQKEEEQKPLLTVNAPDIKQFLQKKYKEISPTIKTAKDSVVNTYNTVTGLTLVQTVKVTTGLFLACSSLHEIAQDPSSIAFKQMLVAGFLLRHQTTELYFAVLNKLNRK